VCKRRLQEKFLGFPEEFVRPPLGAALYNNNNVQVANGIAARMTLYRYDFVEGTDQLTLRGRDQLAKIQAQLPSTFFPIIIERTPNNPELEASRRLAVVTELSQGSFPVPAERVLIGAPSSLGLRGVDGELIYQNQLGRMALGGPPVSAYTGPGGFDAATQTISTLGAPR
jgi:hypothetical protein